VARARDRGALEKRNLTMKRMKGMKREFSELSNRVLGCAIEVHRMLGPGLPESASQQCLATELSLNGMIDFNPKCLKDGLQSFVL
jgi:hypothetical protein